jgi:hypothetical protein
MKNVNNMVLPVFQTVLLITILVLVILNYTKSQQGFENGGGLRNWHGAGRGREPESQDPSTMGSGNNEHGSKYKGTSRTGGPLAQQADTSRTPNLLTNTRKSIRSTV